MEQFVGDFDFPLAVGDGGGQAGQVEAAAVGPVIWNKCGLELTVNSLQKPSTVSTWNGSLLEKFHYFGWRLHERCYSKTADVLNVA